MPKGPDRSPVRTCVGCRRKAAAANLVRLRMDHGELAVGHGHGRGAWICPGVTCLDLAIGRGSLGRALRSSPSKDGLDRVRTLLSEQV